MLEKTRIARNNIIISCIHVIPEDGMALRTVSPAGLRKTMGAQIP